MKILHLEAENILSLGKVSLDFSHCGLTLIEGWNYDDDRAMGAGKTAIFNAVSFGIYGNVPRKITRGEILRYGTKKGHSKVTIETKEGQWRVERYRPNRILFFLNDVEQHITQQEFEEKIGLSYTQFLLVMYCAQNDTKRLISLSDTDKKDFWLTLMNLERFSDHKKNVDFSVKTIKSTIVDLKNKIDQSAAKVSAYQEMIVDVSDLKNSLADLNYDTLVAEIVELASISKPNLDKYDDLISKINNRINQIALEENTYRNKLSNFNVYKRRLDEAKEKLHRNIEIYDLVDCPHCEGKFSIGANGSMTIEDIKRQHREQIQGQVNTWQDELDKLNMGDPVNFSGEKQKLQSLQQKTYNEKREKMAKYEKAQKRISELRTVVERRKSQVENINQKIQQQASIVSNRAKEQAQIDKNIEKLACEQRELVVLETISHILSPVGAPAYIMDSIVDMFNEKMSEYISLIWPNADYQMQTFKETKAGDTKAKFSEKLTIGSRDCSIGSLSGGQYRCMSIAMDCAATDVLSSMFGIEINPIVLDEPFDGLDVVGREDVINLLEKIAENRQIIVIDHASEAKAMFSNIIRVELKNGISRVV